MVVKPLPRTEISAVIGLLEFIDNAKVKEELFRLAQNLQFNLKDILSVTDASELFRFSGSN